MKFVIWIGVSISNLLFEFRIFPVAQNKSKLFSIVRQAEKKCSWITSHDMKQCHFDIDKNSIDEQNCSCIELKRCQRKIAIDRPLQHIDLIYFVAFHSIIHLCGIFLCHFRVIVCFSIRMKLLFFRLPIRISFNRMPILNVNRQTNKHSISSLHLIQYC